MTSAARRSIKEGIGFGIIAGVIFAVIEVLGAALMGNPLLTPFRMFSSIVLGASALEMESLSPGAAFVVGSIVHLALSAIFGLIYGLVNSRLSFVTRTSWGRQAGLGLLFGALLWLIDFQIIARLFYPWFLAAPQLMQLLMHALFFGLPLGLMYAGAERRAEHIRPRPRQA